LALHRKKKATVRVTLRRLGEAVGKRGTSVCFALRVIAARCSVMFKALLVEPGTRIFIRTAHNAKGPPMWATLSLWMVEAATITLPYESMA